MFAMRNNVGRKRAERIVFPGSIPMQHKLQRSRAQMGQSPTRRAHPRARYCLLHAGIGHCLYATHAPLITFGPHDAFLLCCAVTCLLHVTNMCVLVKACDRGKYFPGTEGTFCLSCQAGHYQNVTRSYNEHGMIFSQLHSLLAFA